MLRGCDFLNSKQVPLSSCGEKRSDEATGPKDVIRNHAASGSSHKMLILALPDSAKIYFAFLDLAA
jgi:hypothetical protein